MDPSKDSIDVATKINFNEFYRRLELLNSLNKLYISDDREEWEDEDGNPIPQTTFVSRK